MNLTEIYRVQGDYSDCVENYTEIRDMFSKQFGEKHFITLWTTEGLGNSYRARGMLDHADKWLLTAMLIAIEILKSDDPNFLDVVESCGILRKEQGRFSKAEALYKQALEGNI